MTQVSSLYLHVPFCKHLCNYCDFYKKKLDLSQNQFEDFHQFLSNSISRHEDILNQLGFKWTPLETVYLGGGTPSLWGVEGAEFFKKIIPPLSSNVEFTMEVDPGTWSEELIQGWKSIGLNRISVGTQSLDEKFLKIMDRAHSLDDSLLFLEKLKHEKWNYSLDFLLGIPYSRVKNRDIQKELDILLSFSPKHISLYILNARSKYPLIQDIPDDDYIHDEYLFVSDYLRGKGFHHYEVSNFALPGYESLHNQKYWLGESVAALGPTGVGFLKNSFDKALRYKWKVSHPEVEIEELGRAELELEKMYLGLRTTKGWRPDSITTKLELVFKRWESQGLASYKDQVIVLKPAGFVILDSLVDEIFTADAAQ